jgi:hypothetical protein
MLMDLNILWLKYSFEESFGLKPDILYSSLKSRLPPGQHTPKLDCPVKNRKGGKPGCSKMN